jgi:catechol 2,3-dioxygenase
MSIPRPNYNPPFNLTRASHLVLTVRDLEASLAFYSELIGLVVSERTGDTLYLRGLEEACHHSLVLQRTGTAPVCRRIGLRVFTDDDLDKAESHFRKAGLPAQWVEVAHQGRTLHVTDPQGTPFELCATMTVMPRMVTEFAAFKGGSAHRLDHFQVLVPDVDQACAFHMGLGYRCSEYIVADPQEALSGVFLQRKGNPHDLVLLNGAGPRLHHVAYTSIDAFTLMRACDVAGNLGYGKSVERGPGRHGPGHAQFVYFRDPDGHRIELFTTHYQIMDIENEPVRWDSKSRLRKEIWGLPAQRIWFEEAMAFEGLEPRPPRLKLEPPTLERYLAAQK